MANAALHETDILADVMGAESPDLPTDFARSVLGWHFSQRAVDRMTDLAERNGAGRLNEAELEELDKYRRVGSFINILKAKARLSLQHGIQAAN